MAGTTITLDRETALVLFDCLARWEYHELPLELRDEADEYAILQVLGGLEKTLVEPFQRDYADQVQLARRELLRRRGVE